MNNIRIAVTALVCMSAIAIASDMTKEENSDSDSVNDINITAYGVQPDSHRNATPAFIKAIENAKPGSVIRFPKGRYDFWPADAKKMQLYVSNNSDVNPKRVIGPILNKKNLTIDGQGSAFIYHDQVMPFEIQDSENITLRNFSVDWARPITSQGKIVAITDAYFDMQFLPDSWYEIRNERIVFYGEGWAGTGWGGGQPHDDTTGRIKYQSTGNLGWKGNLNKLKAEDQGNRTVRFYHKMPSNYKVGDVINFRAEDRNNVGIHIYRSKDTLVENVDMHYACAMGVVGQRAENITLRKLRILKPEGSGRRFTVFADATHFSGCKGRIIVEDSYFEHMHDDAINVHGTYVQIVEKIDPRTLKVKYMHGQSKTMDLAAEGDVCWLIDNETMLPYKEITVESFRILDDWHAHVKFKEDWPERVKVKDGLENLTWTPEVIFRRNKIVHNRARGMLFNSARRTLVEDNYVQTAGSAILVAGDCNYWFESGPVGVYGPVIIRNNTFDNCLTNLYQFTHAQISVDPVIPKLIAGGTCYHKDILIENNIFKVFDAPILFARSVDGITFKDNTIERTHDFQPYHYNPHMFKFEGCKKVDIRNNQLKGDVLGRDIKLLKMDKSQVKEDIGLKYVP